MLLSAGYCDISLGGIAPRLNISGSEGVRLQGRNGTRIRVGDNDGDGTTSNKIELYAPYGMTYYDGGRSDDVYWQKLSDVDPDDYVLTNRAG
jgi:hypothetical protein